MDNIVIDVTENNNPVDINAIDNNENVSIDIVVNNDNIVINVSEAVEETVTITAVNETENISIHIMENGFYGPNSFSPFFTYSGEVLTRIDYLSDSSFKIFSYSGEFLTRLEHFLTDYTIKKDFTYASGILVNIIQTTY